MENKVEKKRGGEESCTGAARGTSDDARNQTKQRSSVKGVQTFLREPVKSEAGVEGTKKSPDDDTSPTSYRD